MCLMISGMVYMRWYRALLASLSRCVMGVCGRCGLCFSELVGGGIYG